MNDEIGPRKHEIFVSYSHENQGWIEALELNKDPHGLENASFWIDSNRISPSTMWNEEAAAALHRVTAVVLLISKEFLGSTAIRQHELPIIAKRYLAGEVSVVFVPIGRLNTEDVGAALGIAHVHNLVSVPPWDEALPRVPERRAEVREKIVSAATESTEVQNLRRNILPKYHLRESLGAGPLGEVFTAHDCQLHRKVAVKLLRRRECDRHFKDSVRNVVNATDHTYILSVYGAYLDSVPPHYVRQFVPGDSLRTAMEDYYHGKPLPIPLVKKFISAVGAAVIHAHGHGISGLNLKPSNVVVSNLPSQTTVEYFLSLNSYREEDLLQDEMWRTRRKDVLFLPMENRSRSIVLNQDPRRGDQYRLGLVAYEMLIGSERFEQLAKPLRQPDFEPATWHWPPVALERADCLQYIGDVVDRMIRTDPDDRYESIDAAITDVERSELDVEIVRDSYHRLLNSEKDQIDFFRSFYLTFLDRYRKAEKFFKKNKFGELRPDGPVAKGWERQFQVLKEAVLLLAVFHAFHEDRREPNILTRIAEEHARRGIPEALYEGFFEVLLDNIVEKDSDAPLSPTQLRLAWSNVIRPGINYMKRKTEEIEQARWRSG